jgi:predicted component of type VI protein secretion system
MIAIFFCLPLALAPSAIFAETTKKLSVEEDIPEEVLRTEIYTDARSPIDGKLLTATEYVELMDKLRSLDSISPEDLVSPKVREVVELLRLRKLLRQFIPFIP